jgi:hypothetical protein
MAASLPVQSPDSDLSDSPRDLRWIVFVASGTGHGNPNDLVQYLHGGVWSALGPWAGARTALVTTAFDIRSQTATASLRLRFKIDAGAPPGPAYVVEFVSYVDADQGCTHFTFDANMITVRAPGDSRWLPYAGAVAFAIAAGCAIVLVTRRRKPLTPPPPAGG